MTDFDLFWTLYTDACYGEYKANAKGDFYMAGKFAAVAEEFYSMIPIN